MRGYIFIGKNFVPGEVLYENGIITGVREIDEKKLSPEEKEKYIIPGLVDVHLHGCMGVDFCDCAEKYDNGRAGEVISKMIEYERSAGVTAICPTTMTIDEERLRKIMKGVADFCSDSDNDAADKRAHLLGVHLEGPFISPKKCGAQNPKYVISPDASFVKNLNEISGNMVRLVAIAPETEGAIECIRELTGDGSGIRCSVAHTEADYEQALEAFSAGADHVTHVYNAMPEFSKRTPGVVGAAFDEKSAFVEIICDGNHVHPAVLRASFAMFGPERMIIISDSMEAAGMEDGKYDLGGLEVIKKGNLATLKDGTLAGSVTNLFDCMKVVIHSGIPKEQAILAATLNPARSIGMDDHYGKIAVGAKAFFVVCDKDMNRREVVY